MHLTYNCSIVSNSEDRGDKEFIINTSLYSQCVFNKQFEINSQMEIFMNKKCVEHCYFFAENKVFQHYLRLWASKYLDIQQIIKRITFLRTGFEGRYYILARMGWSRACRYTSPEQGRSPGGSSIESYWTFYYLMWNSLKLRDNYFCFLLSYFFTKGEEVNLKTHWLVRKKSDKIFVNFNFQTFYGNAL